MTTHSAAQNTEMTVEQPWKMAASDNESTSGPIEVTRKRAYLEEPVVALSPKRSNMEEYKDDGYMDDNKYTLKMTIPHYAAGCIIGKSGGTIVEHQAHAHSTIKLSKANEFYPYSKERIVLIVGSVRALRISAKFIQEKIREAVHLFGAKLQDETPPPEERAKQCKVLVPNSTAGLIIGKNGATVKQLMADTDSKVILSQKPDITPIQERYMTVSGEPPSIEAALDRIIDKIKLDPSSGSCPNLVYNMNGLSATGLGLGTESIYDILAMQQKLAYNALASPTVGLLPYASPANAAVATNNMYAQLAASQFAVAPQTALDLQTQLGLYSAQLNQLNSRNTATAAAPAASVAQIQSQMKPAVSALQKEGPVLTQALPQYAAAPVSSAMIQPTALQFYPSNITATQTAIDKAATDRLYAQLQQQMKLMQYSALPTTLQSPPVQPTLQASPIPNNLPTNAIPTATPVQPPVASQPTETIPVNSAPPSTNQGNITVDYEVPENLIGGIIGVAGKTLVEIQTMSGSRIQLSRKGEFVEGTTNRRIQISGSPSAVHKAKLLLQRQLFQTETSRRQSGLTV